MEGEHLRLPKLTGEDDYPMWKLRIRTILEAKELEDTLLYDLPKDDDAQEDFSKLVESAERKGVRLMIRRRMREHA